MINRVYSTKPAKLGSAVEGRTTGSESRLYSVTR